MNRVPPPARGHTRLGYATFSPSSAAIMLAVDGLNPFRRDQPFRWQPNPVISSVGGLGDLFIHLPLIAGLVRRAEELGLQPKVALRPAHAEIGRRVGWDVLPFENPLQYVFNRQFSVAVAKQGLAQIGELRRQRFPLWIDLTGNAFLKLGGIRALASKITRGGRSLTRHHLPHTANENEYRHRERLAEFFGCTLDFNVFARLLAAGASARNADNGDHVVLCITTGCRWRNWPLVNFERLVRHIPGQRFVLTGGGHEIDPGDAVAYETMRRLPNVSDLVNSLDTMGLIHAIAKARAVLTNDSAGAHIANAYGIPGAVLFGPALTGTWHDPHGSLRAFQDLTCPLRPCAQWRCDRPADWCMAKIQVNSVVAHLRDLLAGANDVSSARCSQQLFIAG